ncbi:hypothetical protein KQ298_12195 [Synechococcus sp. CS-1330]|nr:hypothetical protein [Synechococcus sp. CS-1330]
MNIPTKTKGVGAGQASDLKCVEALARAVFESESVVRGDKHLRGCRRGP